MLLSKPMYLGEPGEPWFHSKTLRLPLGIMLHSLWRFWPRTYQAHVTAQDIPQLRKFSEAKPGKPSPQTSQVGCVTIHVHSPHGERLAVKPAAEFTPEWLFPRCDQPKRAYHQDGTDKKNQQRSNGKIRNSLQRHQRGIRASILECDNRQSFDIEETRPRSVQFISLWN